jgi:hypothetical protein
MRPGGPYRDAVQYRRLGLADCGRPWVAFVAMNLRDAPPPLHPFLYRNDAGQIAIRWTRLAVLLAVVFVSTVLVSLALEYILGRPFRVIRLILPLLLVLLPQVVAVHLAKRHAEGKSPWQFSLAALLLERHAIRGRLEKSINEIVGQGNVHVTGQTLIQVQRPTFNDEDLRKILALREQLAEIQSPIVILDLSSTQVTDAGVTELKQIPSLEYCFLLQTAITDASIDALAELPNLKVLGVNSTAVTPDRLLRLSTERPMLNIVPKDYRKLLPK